jgi:2-polyprenyl-3-methyl-5-hydroxy-6-metoxy-1,4-benzoquinol methylase
MNNYQHIFAANKASWNKRAAIHKDSAFYDLDAFKKGKSSLNKVELAALGNVTNKRLLHLQCHFGMDTMSWAREGAIVTGVDLSDEAIRLAREINQELALNAEFICSNIYDLVNEEGKPVAGLQSESFDIVFTSYGTIGWLPDLDQWAGIISLYLKPGGTFYIVDFHPALWMMD